MVGVACAACCRPFRGMHKLRCICHSGDVAPAEPGVCRVSAEVDLELARKQRIHALHTHHQYQRTINWAVQQRVSV
jgi:hypothetical protein